MKRIWNVKIRPSIKREFPNDLMMQELHEIRVRLAKKYPKPVPKIFFRFKQAPLEKVMPR